MPEGSTVMEKKAFDAAGLSGFMGVSAPFGPDCILPDRSLAGRIEVLARRIDRDGVGEAACVDIIDIILKDW